MSNFKLIFLGVFVAAAVFGVLVFSGIINIGGGSSSTVVQGTATIWGTFDSRALSPFLQNFNAVNQDVHINYIQKDSATFDKDLIEAIASGNSPDLVLLPDNLVWRFQDKLTHIPFTSVPLQNFQDTFISSANIFSVSDGTLALPWVSDPLVMYYNRDLLSAAGIATPPKNWQDFLNEVPSLSVKKSDLTITQSAAALGSYDNISHAKDVLALLFLESGNSFITNGDIQPAVHFGASAKGDENNVANNVMDFFVSFANPIKQTYTWNAGQPLDRDLFIQSGLAYYFGTASDLTLIRAQNPNLNFGIALPPQSKVGLPVTTGHIYGFAIPKGASNQVLSFTASTLLVNSALEGTLNAKLGSGITVVPARRDALAQTPTSDPYLSFLYNSALIQKSWLDPNPITSDQIFSDMIKNINSSILTIDQSLMKASSQLSILTSTIQ